MNIFSNGKDANPFDDESEEWDDAQYALEDNGEPGVPVKALYDYEAAEPDELTFKTGKKIVSRMTILTIILLQVTSLRNWRMRMSKVGAREGRMAEWACILLTTWSLSRDDSLFLICLPCHQTVTNSITLSVTKGFTLATSHTLVENSDQ